MSARQAAVLGLVSLLVLTVPAAGQAPAARNPRAERVIEALLIWRLVDELNLTDRQIAQIFPRIKDLKDLRLDLGREKVRLQRDLRDLLAQQPRDQDAIRAKVTELEQLRDQIDRRRQRLLREIVAVLTIEQRAKFVLIQDTFEADTIRLLEEVRRTVEEQRRTR